MDKIEQEMQEQEAAEAQAIAKQELENLKAEAKALGVKYHPSSKAETIRAKIKAKKLELEEGNADDSEAVEETVEVPVAKTGDGVVRNADGTVDKSAYAGLAPRNIPGKVRAALRKEALEMVRIKVTCMNPAKKEMKGDFFMFQNDVIGIIKKFVPFNTEHADSYHVPRCIYNMLQNKKFQTFSKVRGKNGIMVPKSRLVKEFAVEVLPPLTDEEFQAIRDKQLLERRDEE